jgi:Type II secretion system (T2SS), protein E, N-terminal domain
MKQERLEMLMREEHMREICNCSPLSMLSYSVGRAEQQTEIDFEQLVPAAVGMKKRLRAMVDPYFSHTGPFSLLLLHVVQLEQSHIAEGEMHLARRCRYHATPELLEQILANVQRVIRHSDILLVHKGVGAALLLADTDQWSAYVVLERIYNSISLLQSETVIPPLAYETIISMGIGTYPDPSPSLERLLEQVGNVERSLVLRPSITAQLRAIRGSEMAVVTDSREVEGKRVYDGVPFMKLPGALPRRLQQLVPYQVALQLRCVPVGREQRCLTVAMAEPLDNENTRRLQELTGMNIFPVACREEELAALLAVGW